MVRIGLAGYLCVEEVRIASVGVLRVFALSRRVVRVVVLRDMFVGVVGWAASREESHASVAQGVWCVLISVARGGVPRIHARKKDEDFV